MPGPPSSIYNEIDFLRSASLSTQGAWNFGIGFLRGGGGDVKVVIKYLFSYLDVLFLRTVPNFHVDKTLCGSENVIVQTLHRDALP